MQTQIIDSRDAVKGDTILNDDNTMRTIGRDDIKYYQNTPRKMLRRVLFAKWFKGEIVSYQTQL